MFSVGDDTRQSNGITTLCVGGVHLPNLLIDSGVTSNLLGKPTWEWLKVIYKLGRTNIADALSRLNCRVPCGEGQHYDHVRSEVENSTSCALTPSEIEKALAADPEISLVKECVHIGDSNACNIPAYLHVKNELCSYGQLLLHGSRIVIPQVLQEHFLKLAHEGHQGM